MLTVTIKQEDGIAILEPEGALSKDDFESAASIIDRAIEQSGKLNGIIIHTKSFPGWDSFAALIAHLEFIKNHHRKISHVAFVTDTVAANIAEKIGSHFVEAEIRTFAYSELRQACNWVLGNPSSQTTG